MSGSLSSCATVVVRGQIALAPGAAAAAEYGRRASALGAGDAARSQGPGPRYGLRGRRGGRNGLRRITALLASPRSFRSPLRHFPWALEVTLRGTSEPCSPAINEPVEVADN
jgi:hypothetical protein